MQMSSTSRHAQFFTSLRHLEKRLKLEHQHATSSSNVSPPPPSLPAEAESNEIIKDTEQTHSLGTPIYLATTANTNASDLEGSEIPREFLSTSPDFSPSLHTSPQGNQSEARPTIDETERFNLDDDIEILMELLRLHDSEEELDERTGINNLGCDDGFYGKIVGVKGPKSAEEADRLERWIKHHLKDKKTEPLRLAHLLLGKAAFVHSDDDCDGFGGGFVFPSTIDEFLLNDPPTE